MGVGGGLHVGCYIWCPGSVTMFASLATVREKRDGHRFCLTLKSLKIVSLLGIASGAPRCGDESRRWEARR